MISNAFKTKLGLFFISRFFSFVLTSEIEVANALITMRGNKLRNVIVKYGGLNSDKFVYCIKSRGVFVGMTKQIYKFLRSFGIRPFNSYGNEYPAFSFNLSINFPILIAFEFLDFFEIGWSHNEQIISKRVLGVDMNSTKNPSK
jgi:hypothetical protein